MGAIKAAVGDAVLTAMWVFSASTLGALTSVIASAIGVQGMAALVITTVLIFLLVTVFGVIGDALGGASFNPTGTAAFYAAGIGGDSLYSMALRFPAQAAGAVGGALAIVEVMPIQYKHMLGGPSLKVDLHTGALAEGILTFIITFAVLFIVLKGPRSPLLKTWLISMSTVVMIVTGSSYTGPSMNPANAFGWAYVNNRHNTWEQFYVYWICPFIGAILAAFVFRTVFPPPSFISRLSQLKLPSSNPSMAQIGNTKIHSLNEQYLLAKEEKQDMSMKAAEEPEVKNPANTTSEEVATPKTEENLVVSTNGVSPAADDESSGASTTTTEESNITTPVAEGSASEATKPTAEESSESADQEDSGDQDAEETKEIKLETAPADFRFPTTNQSRHCFTRYIEYHRCVAAKGEGAPECDKFAKYYRSLCPGEWVDRWNEQRENGTFPGPL